MRIIFKEFSAMNNLNSLLNHHQNSSLHEFHNHGGNFGPAPSHDEFLDKMLSSVPSTTASFPWGGADDHSSVLLGHLGDQSTAMKMRQQQLSNAAAKALMLQQQLMLSAADDFRSPSGADAGLLPFSDRNDVVSGCSFLENDSSIKAVFNGFNGLLGQTSNQPQHFHHIQPENFGVMAAAELSQVTAGGGEVVDQAMQKPRAKRGQATDPHSIAERLRRERIAERMKSLQGIVPNASKTDKASMLDEIIDYVKFLRLQVNVLSMSRLGGATVAPLLGEQTSQGKSRNGAETASSSQNDEGMTVAEQQVAKLMEDDMGAAMQYLQGKGLCLMPISLATAISTTKPALNGEARGPTSPSMSVSTIQSAPMGGGSSGGQHSVKGSSSVS